MRTRSGAAAPWLIGMAAAGCGVWAVVDFVAAARPDAPAAVVAEATPARDAAGRAVELHRLLADGDLLDDVGALVSVTGQVVDPVGGGGFWVRDLRDYVVRVTSGERPRAGARVRVVGRLDRLAALPRLAEPTDDGASVLRGVQVVARGAAALQPLPE